MLLPMKIIQHVWEVNYKRCYSFSLRFTSADEGARWCDDENEAMISRISGKPPKILMTEQNFLLWSGGIFLFFPTLSLFI